MTHLSLITAFPLSPSLIVEKIFEKFGASERGVISERDVMRYMKAHAADGELQDVWDLFGRSMLKDFPYRKAIA
jgi:hypothetical protein